VLSRKHSIRWMILAMLFGFSFVSYVERVNISVAAELMMPALSLTKTEMGQIFTSFLLGYAIFQVPAGFLGDRIGPRLTLFGAALGWGITTILTGLVPGSWVFRTSARIFASLWTLRFLLGATEAATYPVAARSVRNWMPLHQRGLGNSLVLAGSSVATAITAPAISWLMVSIGWRQSFYASSSLAFFIGLIWFRYATDYPVQHRYATTHELELIGSPSKPSESPALLSASIRSILRQRRVALLSLSYISEGYILFIFVFWLYVYLVEVRGFSILRGGLITALPWLTAAAFTPCGGVFCDYMATKRGVLGGARLIIVSSYLGSGVLLLAAAQTHSRLLAVGSLCLSVGLLYLAEPAFWTSAVYLSQDQAGTVGGIMNTAGIIGGILSTSLLPLLVKHFGWGAAFGSGTAMALFSMLIWSQLGGKSPNSQTRSR